jgi:DNA-binding transcriptional MerR regulator
MGNSERRISISNASEQTGIPVHVLRQWEARFSQLKPKRDRSNRRYYQDKDLSIVERIKELVYQDKMTLEGASKKLELELKGTHPPETTVQMRKLINTIEKDVRAALNLMDETDRRLLESDNQTE